MMGMGRGMTPMVPVPVPTTAAGRQAVANTSAPTSTVRSGVVPVIQPTKTETVNGVTIITIQPSNAHAAVSAPPPPCNIFVGRIPNNLGDQTIRQLLDVIPFVTTTVNDHCTHNNVDCCCK
jgi:hypothetical protein